MDIKSQCTIYAYHQWKYSTVRAVILWGNVLKETTKACLSFSYEDAYHSVTKSFRAWALAKVFLASLKLALPLKTEQLIELLVDDLSFFIIAQCFKISHLVIRHENDPPHFHTNSFAIQKRTEARENRIHLSVRTFNWGTIIFHQTHIFTYFKDQCEV